MVPVKNNNTGFPAPALLEEIRPTARSHDPSPPVLTWASNGAVENVRAVSSADDEDHLSRPDAIDLGQNLVDHSDAQKQEDARNVPRNVKRWISQTWKRIIARIESTTLNNRTSGDEDWRWSFVKKAIAF